METLAASFEANGLAMQIVRLESSGTTLAGIVTLPAGTPPGELGVVFVNGPSQYRAGPHRQFTIAARALAAEGIPALRFDVPGTGDSDGVAPGAGRASRGEEIVSAIDALQGHCPRVRRVVLWGLGDGACTIMLNAWRDKRVAGTVLLNPTVPAARADRAMALPSVARMIDTMAQMLRRLAGVLRLRPRLDSAAAADDGRLPLPRRLYLASAAYEGRVLLILGGNDPFADTFRRLLERAPWQALLSHHHWTRHVLAEATHTFPGSAAREQIRTWVLEWLTHLK